jgi:hypothetical protein
MTDDPWAPAGRRAAIATMHGKERAIGPALERLGLAWSVPAGLDTDRFGTFTREVARAGSALDAARAKALAALALDPGADVAVASEGSFGPHPSIPLLPIGRELVLLVDRRTGLEVAGHHASPDVSYAQAAVGGADEAAAFAARVGFPAQALAVAAMRDGLPDPAAFLEKGIADADALARAVAAAVAATGGAFVETDMRAHANPARMAAVARAADDLARRFASRCPGCGRPGWDVAERLAGLPCSGCGAPTGAVRAEVLRCAGCGLAKERPSAQDGADPGLCPECNP